ncbi:hypothetical protein VTO42DRAFT_5752 [Malbranchea cinnamomea]
MDPSAPPASVPRGGSSSRGNSNDFNAGTGAGLDFLSLHPFVRATVRDKIRGTIVGSALGDCVGLYTEFLSKQLVRDAYPDGRFQLVDPATEFRRDSHRDKFDQKAWTDDTDHALLILLSYLHHDGELSSQDVAERLRSWVSQGLLCLGRPPLGLGRTVGSVVMDKAYLSNPARTAYRCWIKSNRKMAPNGSLMRTHPLGIICLAYTLEETFHIAAEFSTITHADPRCVVACCISTALIRGMLRGEVLNEEDLDLILEEAYKWADEWVRNGRGGADYLDLNDGQFVDGDLLDRDEFDRHVRAKTFEDLQLDDFAKIGYVYKCLGSAVLALRFGMRQAPQNASATATATKKLSHAAVFEQTITAITLEAGDADTNACVAGALLGCWIGYNSLPAHWRDGMMHLDWLVGKCDGLSCVLGVTQSPSEYRGSEDPDTRFDGGKGLMDEEQLAERDREFMARYMAKHAEGVEQERKRLEEEKKNKKKGWTGILSSLAG